MAIGAAKPKGFEVVYDARTGYPIVEQPAGHFDSHPYGEGEGRVNWVCKGCDNRIFQTARPEECPKCAHTTFVEGPQRIIKWYATSQVDNLWEWVLVDIDQPRLRRPKMKLDLIKQKTAKRVTSGKLANKYEVVQDELVKGTEAELNAETMRLDTHLATLRTVGTSETHATISDGVNAGNSGDTVECHETTLNTYNEAVDYGDKQLTIICVVGDQGLKITYSAAGGYTVYMRNANDDISVLENFELEGTGGGANACVLANAFHQIIRDCRAHGTSWGFYINGTGCRTVNSCAHGCGKGFHANDSNIAVYDHCVAVDNTTGGFDGVKAMRWCLSDNGDAGGTDFVGGTAVLCQHNTSGDGTAPGSDPITGFVRSDLDADYKIKDAVKDTTLAKHVGYPLAHMDAFQNARKTRSDGGETWAGWHTPDPAGAPAIPADPSWDGVMTAGDGQVTVPITADDPADIIYVRYRKGGEDWSAENESFKRTGSGDVIVTGLTNGTVYWFTFYAKASGYTSDWAEPRSAMPEAAAAVTTWNTILGKQVLSWSEILL